MPDISWTSLGGCRLYRQIHQKWSERFWKRTKFVTNWYTIYYVRVQPIARNRVGYLEITQTKKKTERGLALKGVIHCNNNLQSSQMLRSPGADEVARTLNVMLHSAAAKCRVLQ